MLDLLGETQQSKLSRHMHVFSCSCNGVLHCTFDCVLAVAVAGNSNQPANTRIAEVAEEAVAAAVVDNRVYQNCISTSFAAVVAY